MNIRQLKHALSETIPMTVYYRIAKPLRQKGGRTLKRVSGRTEDTLLILEAIGDPGGLKEVKFTCATDNPPVLERNIRGIERVAGELCGEKGQGIAWFDILVNQKPLNNGVIQIAYQLIEGIPLAFVTLKKGK
jgi:hypothetical protein